MGSVVRVYPGPPCFVLTAMTRSSIACLRTARRTIGDGLAPCKGAQPNGWFWGDWSSVDGSLAFARGANLNGAVAQLGEHLLCKQGVSGSIPLSSTKVLVLMRVENILVFEEIKVCITSMKCCLFCKIVKRRLIWRLPGVGFTHVRALSR